MSYAGNDLGYEMGYEGDDSSFTSIPHIFSSPKNSHVTYQMSRVGDPLDAAYKSTGETYKEIFKNPSDKKTVEQPPAQTSTAKDETKLKGVEKSNGPKDEIPVGDKGSSTSVAKLRTEVEGKKQKEERAAWEKKLGTLLTPEEMDIVRSQKIPGDELNESWNPNKYPILWEPDSYKTKPKEYEAAKKEAKEDALSSVRGRIIYDQAEKLYQKYPTVYSRDTAYALVAQYFRETEITDPKTKKTKKIDADADSLQDIKVVESKVNERINNLPKDPAQLEKAQKAAYQNAYDYESNAVADDFKRQVGELNRKEANEVPSELKKEAGYYTRLWLASKKASEPGEIRDLRTKFNYQDVVNFYHSLPKDNRGSVLKGSPRVNELEREANIENTRGLDKKDEKELTKEDIVSRRREKTKIAEEKRAQEAESAREQRQLKIQLDNKLRDLQADLEKMKLQGLQQKDYGAFQAGLQAFQTTYNGLLQEGFAISRIQFQQLMKEAEQLGNLARQIVAQMLQRGVGPRG